WQTSSTSATPSMRNGKWKIHLPRKKNSPIELYDLSTDPSESNNLAQEKPEVVSKLTTKLRAWTDQLPESYEKLKGKKE
ncbi:MAG: Cerebroside-sulfatase, partial [Verrucomicrobiota bacterium]